VCSGAPALQNAFGPFEVTTAVAAASASLSRRLAAAGCTPGLVL
jgi:hypothetical protein